jgi:hypothetical protein
MSFGSEMQFNANVNKAILGPELNRDFVLSAYDTSGLYIPVIRGSHRETFPIDDAASFPTILDLSNDFELRSTNQVNLERLNGVTFNLNSNPEFTPQNIWLNYGKDTKIPNSDIYPGLVVGGPTDSSPSNNAFIWAKRLIQNQNGYGVSDRRIKTSVTLSDYEDAYNKVNNIPVNSYRYLDDTLNPVDPDIPAQPFGFIANEVRSQLPNAVINITGNFTETGALIAPFDNSSNQALSELNVLDKNSVFQLLFAAFKHSQNKITNLESHPVITLDLNLSQNLANLQNFISSEKMFLGLGANTNNIMSATLVTRHIYGKAYNHDRLANIYLQYSPERFYNNHKDKLSSLGELPPGYNIDYDSTYGGIDMDRSKYEFDVYIGGPHHKSNLFVTGNIFSSSQGYPSDQRIKQNITSASTSNAYNLVSQFSLKSYDYVDISRNSTDYGFIAQEVETIFPSAVITSEGNFTFNGAKISPDDQTTTTDFTDMKVLNKDKIMQLLFAAFQESQIKIADLERRLNAIGA